MLMNTDRAAWTFGQLLDWHLQRGTRPAATSAEKGAPWGNKEFANAIGKAKNAAQPPSERTIRNWRHGETLPEPTDFNAVLTALFGGKSEYVDWRGELTNKYHQARAARDGDADEALADASAMVLAGSVPTPPLRCLGRDEDLTAIIRALTAEGGRIAILVLGGPGMGKTTLTRQAATDTAIVERFGNRRWFVELETVTDTETFETAVVKALGLDPTTAKFNDAVALLGRAPGLLVLDNLETPWDGARREVESLLDRLHRVPSLTLLASIRGNEPPAGLRWTRQRTMHPLESPHDRELFLDIAQDIKAEDWHLDPLLAELGGVPLAVELVAMQAAPHDTLAALYEEWQRVGIALAERRSIEPSRLTSLERSLELSFASAQLGNAGRRLFAILGQFPAGVAAADLSALLEDQSFEARQGLLSSGLGIERKGRLDLLPPVRDHALRLHQPSTPDSALWRFHFLQIAASHGDRIATLAGTGSVAWLAVELPNLEAAQRAAVRAGDLHAAIRALGGIAIVMQFTGLGSPSGIRELLEACRTCSEIFGEAYCAARLGEIARTRSDHDAARKAYEQALPLFQQLGQRANEANCIASLGDIALDRSNYEDAHKAYEQALPLYRQVGQILGEANCIARLGDIALATSDHAAAQKAYERALPFYQQVGQILGEANCVLGLGDIAFERSNYADAHEAYERALPLYRQVGQIVGEANCIQSLGDVALQHSDYEQARKAYERALPIYRQVGHIAGAASCIQSLGDIAFRRSDYDAAAEAYERALPLFRQVGSVLGEANCIRCLADVSLGRSDQEAARRKYREALNLYEQISEPYSIGLARRQLALLSEGDEQRQHVSAAREAWASIDRSDLVALLDDWVLRSKRHAPRGRSSQ